MIKERMGLSTGGFPDYDMSFIKDMPESDFCELSSRMTDAAQQALREVGIAVLTYDRVHGIDRDPSVDYNTLKRKSVEREDETYGTRIHQSRGLRDTEPYTEQGTTGTADEIRTYAQDLAQKNYRAKFDTMLMFGELQEHCLKVQKRAQDEMDRIVPQMKNRKG